MKKCFNTIYILLLFVLNLQAQQDPLFTHYDIIKNFYNPSYAGFDGLICTSILNRQQWLKFEGSPQTSLISADMPLNIANQNFGLGINILNDKYGFIQDIKATFSLSYFTQISTAKIGIGIAPSILNEKFNSQWKFPQQPENILTANSQATILDLNLGSNIEINNFNLGISITHLLNPVLKFSDKVNDVGQIQLVRHYYLNAMYIYNFEKYSIDIIPSILLKSSGNNLQFDINFNILNNKKFLFGVSYRNKSAVTLRASTYLNNIQIGAAYDIPINSIVRVSYGSFEFYISYCFSIVKKIEMQIYKNIKSL